MSKRGGPYWVVHGPGPGGGPWTGGQCYVYTLNFLRAEYSDEYPAGWYGMVFVFSSIETKCICSLLKVWRKCDRDR